MDKEPASTGWKKRAWSVFRILLAVYLGLGMLLFLRQRSLIYYPQIGDPQACGTFLRTGVAKIGQGDTTLYFKESEPILAVFYHGNGGTACDRKFLADFFAESGVSYLFVEYAGYGDGRPSNKNNLEQNVRDAEEFIRTKSFSRIILIGESLGTSLAAYHASLRQPDGLVLLSPYTSLADVAGYHYPAYPARLMIRDNYRVDLSARDFSGRLLIIHGLADNIMPQSFGEKVFAAARFAEKEAYWPEGRGHNDLYEDPEVLNKIRNFIDFK